MPGELSLNANIWCHAVSLWLELGREGYDGERLFSTGVVHGVLATPLQPRDWAPTRHAKSSLAFCVRKHRQLPARTTNLWYSLRFTSVLGWRAACLMGSQLKSPRTVPERAFMTAGDCGFIFSESALCSLQVRRGPDLLQAGEV